MDDLCPHNQDLEECVLNIQQHRQEDHPTEETKVMDPNISLMKIGALVPKNFKLPSLTMFDGRSNPQVYIA